MDPNLPFQPPAPVEPVQPIVPAMPPMESIPVPPPAKKTNWILILGIVLLLVSVLALVGYYLYQSNQSRVNVSTPLPSGASAELGTSVPTTDPTADWKTYTENSIGLTFKYPLAWSVTKSPGQKLNIVITPDPKNEKGLIPMQLMIDSANEYNGYVDFVSIQQAQTHYLKSLNNGAKITNNLTIGEKKRLELREHYWVQVHLKEVFSNILSFS